MLIHILIRIIIDLIIDEIINSFHLVVIFTLQLTKEIQIKLIKKPIWISVKEVFMRKILLLLVFTFCMTSTSAEKALPVEPDYTKGEKLEGRFIYWNLGPIGAYGNIWSTGGSDVTNKTRMIQIHEIFKDSPAVGKLERGDVILGVISPELSHGVKNSTFTENAPKVLSHAITEAEKNEHGGKLVLNVWRKGQKISVTITLPVMGAYSSTAPYNCPKTEKIIKNGVAAIIKNESLAPLKRHRNMLTASLNGLALLATGDKKHWKLVGNFVKLMNNKSEEEYQKTRAWFLAYQNLLACEYYLCTKDEEALPVIRKLSQVIAGGRSAVGTWSHGIADVKQNDGKPFGMPCAYGAMNQITVTCALSLALAQKCGVKNEVIDTAVIKSAAYLRFYVDKGCLPYGDHTPGRVHDNNGSSSHAAVLFNILGDQEAAEFFTRMSLAAKSDRERGHTGPFFSRLWGPLGAAVGGRYATLEFDKITRWRHELQRRHDGGFVYQFSLKKEDRGKYRNWDTTGARLLEYCLSRKQLYITGRGGSSVKAFTQSESAEIAATGSIRFAGKSSQELLMQLKHWSPVIRKSAAQELGEQKLKVVDQLLKMLSSGDRYSRYGAYMALQYAGMASEKALDVIINEGLNDKSGTMRYYALQGLMLNSDSKEHGLAPVVHRAIPKLVEVICTDYPDEYRTWTRAYATFALFDKKLMTEANWQKIPLEKRLEVIRTILKMDDGNARSAMSNIYKNLTKQEIALLLPDIYMGVKKPAPSGVMFGKGVRTNGLRILAQNHIAEGLQTGMDYLFEYGHGGYAKRMGGVGAIKYYGRHLPKEFVDKLEKAVKVRGGMKNDFKAMRNTPEPELISMEEFIRKHSGKIK